MAIIYNHPNTKKLRSSLRNNLTDAEKLIWRHLRRKQVLGAKFVRQFAVDEFMLDFYSPRLKLAIEIDGGQHNETNQVNYDERRTKFLNDLGIKVIRFWNNEVINNIEGVMLEIELEVQPLLTSPLQKGRENKI